MWLCEPKWISFLAAVLSITLQAQAHTGFERMPQSSDDPFRDISPEHHYTIEYLTTNDQGHTSNSKGYGFHYTFGKVHTPVNPIQFIAFTEKLATRIRASWALAHDIVKTHHGTGVQSTLPMAAGLLIFDGEHGAEFSFLTQSRPHDVFNLKDEGTDMLHMSNVKQAQKKYPKSYAKFTEDIKVAKVGLEGLESFYIDQHQKAQNNPLCQEILAAVDETKKVLMSGIGLLSGRLIELELHLKDLLIKTQHCTKGACVECKQLMRIRLMGRQDHLKGAWIISFGEDEYGQWGARPACAGQALEFGCQDLLRDNDVLDLGLLVRLRAKNESPRVLKGLSLSVL